MDLLTSFWLMLIVVLSVCCQSEVRRHLRLWIPSWTFSVIKSSSTLDKTHLTTPTPPEPWQNIQKSHSAPLVLHLPAETQKGFAFAAISFQVNLFMNSFYRLTGITLNKPFLLQKEGKSSEPPPSSRPYLRSSLPPKIAFKPWRKIFYSRN